MTNHKPNRRERARIAWITIKSKWETQGKKPPSAATRQAYEVYTRNWQASCDDSDFGKLMSQMMPADLSEARVDADFARCMTGPSQFAYMAEALGETVAEFRRERDEALKRLEAAAHTLSLVNSA